jgi:glycosyltransferase involved in cell wall biosynthesis
MTERRGDRRGAGDPPLVREATGVAQDDRPRSRSSPPLVPDVGVVALVPDPWEGCWQSRHYILSRLARYFHIVWCNPVDGYGGRRPNTRNTESRDTPPGFMVRDPPSWIPGFGLNQQGTLARLMMRHRFRGARRELAQRGCDRVLLSIWRPSYAAALDVVPHQVSCYHIDDEYTFSDVEQGIDEREATLIRRVDQVFVSSRALMDKKGHLNPNTRFVPNGVNYAAYIRSWPEPLDLQPIPHPRIGYIGVIKRQLDLQLLHTLAQQHAQWSFVFVGPQTHPDEIGTLIGRLANLSNVHFLGAKPVAALPGYTQHMDACMLCYKVDGYTKFIYPLKLHESLASGRPCVGAPIPTLQEFRSVLDLAGTVEEWSEALAAALSPTARLEDRSAAGREVARHHDWDRLVHQIATAIGDRLGPSYRQRIQQGMPDSRTLVSGDSREGR